MNEVVGWRWKWRLGLAPSNNDTIDAKCVEPLRQYYNAQMCTKALRLIGAHQILPCCRVLPYDECNVMSASACTTEEYRYLRNAYSI